MTALLPLLARNWKLITAGLLAAVAVTLILIARADARHYKLAWEGEKAAHALTVQNYRLASEKARLANLEAVRTVEGKAAALTEGTQNDMEAQLAAARASAAKYAGSVRCPSSTNSGSDRKADTPETARPTSSVDGAGSLSVVPADDLRICAEAVTKARAWPEWYAKLRETMNTD